MHTSLMEKNHYIFVVDGGGTKTAACLFEKKEGNFIASQEIARAKGKASGLALGVENAKQIIESLLGYCVGMSGADLNHAHIDIVLGLAGSELPKRASELKKTLSHLGSIHLISDAHMALLGAHQGKAGISLTIGTGSVVWAMSSKGKIKRKGGWGFPAGDKASGAWLGYQAFSKFLRHKDGLPSKYPFSKALENHIEETIGNHPDDWHQFHISAGAKDYGQFAKTILEIAYNDPSDEFCKALEKQVIKEAIHMIKAVQKKTPLPIALNGSVALAISSKLAAKRPEWHFITSKDDPINGGLIALDIIKN